MKGTHGGNVLRKLALNHKYLNDEMTTNLKNLTELHVMLDMWREYGVGEIGNVLGMFPNGQLKKFSLSDYPRVKENREIYMDELIGMLAQFQIENVALEMINLKEKGSKMGAVGITSIHLDDCKGISFEFLNRLPNLRFLRIFVGFERDDE